MNTTTVLSANNLHVIKKPEQLTVQSRLTLPFPSPVPAYLTAVSKPQGSLV